MRRLYRSTIFKATDTYTDGRTHGFDLGLLCRLDVRTVVSYTHCHKHTKENIGQTTNNLHSLNDTKTYEQNAITYSANTQLHSTREPLKY